MSITNPNEWIYLAIAGNNGWAARPEPLEAMARAATNGRTNSATVVLYYVRQDTWDVDFMGGIRCSDIRKGSPVPVGVYSVDVELDLEDDVDWGSTVISPAPQREFQEFMDNAWQQWRRNVERADRLV